MESTLHIQARQLGKQVRSGERTLTLLQDVNLQILKGSSTAIIGSSGSGKTTLLGLLAGLDLPSQGKVDLLGQQLNNLSEDQRAQLRLGRVGFVFQSFQLLPSLTAMENVALALELAGDKDSHQKAEQTLVKVGLADRLTHYPKQLSGGEQQRVALARAFVIQPEVLFADEPTGNLDETTGEQIIELMFQLQNETQTTLVLVTHDRHLAEQCAMQYLIENAHLHAA